MGGWGAEFGLTKFTHRIFAEGVNVNPGVDATAILKNGASQNLLLTRTTTTVRGELVRMAKQDDAFSCIRYGHQDSKSVEHVWCQNE